MALITRFGKPILPVRIVCCRFQSTQPDASSKRIDDEEFPVLNFKQVKTRPPARRRTMKEVPPPRFQQMATDQDWGAVWPGPKSFNPSAVPLPLRQGYVSKKHQFPPGKFANAELMKIPNFLHLTPPVIKKQCEALKQFCTPWPKGLESEDKMKQHFPVDFISSDYCHALPTIRNPLSRIVTIQLKLDTLKLNKHAKDKFLRLVGERYNPDTDVLTLVTDRCPLKKQNYDHAMYLLTALYHESNIVEPWEETKSEADMEYYDFNRNRAKISSEAILNWNKPEDVQRVEAPQSYARSIEQLFNDGENEYNLQKYKEQTLSLLGLVK
ncbi:28S ribosomal protein S35, mitochondrial [Toxorhynchites rutilus septentrionalis]|uniref:28S ribosomal protein S35, mitochondrial n=1 Tax=Toxorhynchites rutilus septentrionalis TaxID=329112 RepID=UPI002479F7B8|nr:28S ribosomal protein S35, mitochondrial [Toxorhynchites rutilus septentrionalis]